MSGKYEVLKKVTISISGAFGVTPLTKREVLRAIQSDLATTNGLVLYVKDAEVTVTLDSGYTRILEDESPTLSPFESLLKPVQDCIAQNQLKDYDADTDILTEEQLAKLRLLTKDECFDAWCDWNGLINHGDLLRNVYRQVYAKYGIIP